MEKAFTENLIRREKLFQLRSLTLNLFSALIINSLINILSRSFHVAFLPKS